MSEVLRSQQDRTDLNLCLRYTVEIVQNEEAPCVFRQLEPAVKDFPHPLKRTRYIGRLAIDISRS